MMWDIILAKSKWKKSQRYRCQGTAQNTWHSSHLMSSSIHAPTQPQSSRATIPLTGSFTLIWQTHTKRFRQKTVGISLLSRLCISSVCCVTCLYSAFLIHPLKTHPYTNCGNLHVRAQLPEDTSAGLQLVRDWTGNPAAFGQPALPP